MDDAVAGNDVGDNDSRAIDLDAVSAVDVDAGPLNRFDRHALARKLGRGHPARHHMVGENGHQLVLVPIISGL